MPLFCPVCNNLMITMTTSDTFLFKCVKCESVVNPSDKDTLRFEEIRGTDLTIYGSILRNASKDPVNPKVQKKCKCGKDVVRQVRLGTEMKLVNTCISCDNQWIEGVD